METPATPETSPASAPPRPELVVTDNNADALAGISRRVSALETEEREERKDATHVFLGALAISALASLIVFAVWHGVVFLFNQRKASTT